MSAVELSLQTWIGAAVEATYELSSVSLGLDQISVASYSDKWPDDALVGAHIAVVSSCDRVQLGILAKRDVCRSLANILLGVDPSDKEELTSSDVADAVGEIANIVAGGVKGRLSEKTSGLSLGLPIFVHGKVETSQACEVVVANMTLGDLKTSLLVLRTRDARGESQ